MRRWLVLDSPKWVKNFLIRRCPIWFAKHNLYYTLADEIKKEIDAEIIREIQEVANEVNRD